MHAKKSALKVENVQMY